MSAMIGADVEQLRALARSFEQSASRLRGLSAVVRSGIQLSAWAGPFAVRFRHTWDSEHACSLRVAADALDVAASRLEREATAQEQASSAGYRGDSRTTQAPASTRDMLNLADGDSDGDGVRIMRVLGSDGVERVIVNIDGTRPQAMIWDLYDWTENVDAVNGIETQTQRYIEAKLKEFGVTSSDQVVLVGYSQGGLLAQNIANTGRYGDALVVTRASPQVLGGVGSHDILRFEVERDVIVDRANPHALAQDMLRAVGIHGSGTDHVVRGSGGSGLQPANPITNAVINSNPITLAIDLGAGTAVHTNGLPFYGNLADQFDAATDPQSRRFQGQLDQFMGGQVVDDSH